MSKENCDKSKMSRVSNFPHNIRIYCSIGMQPRGWYHIHSVCVWFVCMFVNVGWSPPEHSNPFMKLAHSTMNSNRGVLKIRQIWKLFINFQNWVDFEVSQLLVLFFSLTDSLIILCGPRYVYFRTITRLL